jgi:hypothetical protein
MRTPAHRSLALIATGAILILGGPATVSAQSTGDAAMGPSSAAMMDHGDMAADQEHLLTAPMAPDGAPMADNQAGMAPATGPADDAMLMTEGDEGH